MPYFTLCYIHLSIFGLSAATMRSGTEWYAWRVRTSSIEYSDNIVISTSNNHHIKYHVQREANGTCYRCSSYSTAKHTACCFFLLLFSLVLNYISFQFNRCSFSICKHLVIGRCYACIKTTKRISID